MNGWGAMILRTDPLYAQIVETWDQIRRRVEAEGGAEADDFAWVHGGMLLFTLLRLLLSDPRAASDAVRAEILATLTDLRGRVDGATTQAAYALPDVELSFLSAFNDYLMARHDQRLRFDTDGSLTLVQMALGDRLRVAVTVAEGRGLR